MLSKKKKSMIHMLDLFFLNEERSTHRERLYIRDMCTVALICILISISGLRAQTTFRWVFNVEEKEKCTVT